MSRHGGGTPRIPNLIRKLCIPIAIFWPALAASTNALVPQLEEVGRIHNVAQASRMRRRRSPPNGWEGVRRVRHRRVGHHRARGDQPSSATPHRFGDQLVERMRADTEHVQHVQYFWGDPLTAAGAQSNDGKAAQIQVYLAGDAGGSQANESVEAVRKIVADTHGAARQGLRLRPGRACRRRVHAVGEESTEGHRP